MKERRYDCKHAFRIVEISRAEQKPGLSPLIGLMRGRGVSFQQESIQFRMTMFLHSCKSMSPKNSQRAGLNLIENI